jgi:hypothetical protein
LFIGTPIERDKYECGRDGHAQNMQHTNVVTYFTLRSVRSDFILGDHAGERNYGER